MIVIFNEYYGLNQNQILDNLFYLHISNIDYS